MAGNSTKHVSLNCFQQFFFCRGEGYNLRDNTTSNIRTRTDTSSPLPNIASPPLPIRPVNDRTHLSDGSSCYGSKLGVLKTTCVSVPSLRGVKNNLRFRPSLAHYPWCIVVGKRIIQVFNGIANGMTTSVLLSSSSSPSLTPLFVFITI